MSIDLENLRQSAAFLQQALSEGKPPSPYAQCEQAQVREPRYVRYVECAKAQLGTASRLAEVAPVFGYGRAREEAVDLALKNAQMAVESLVLLKAEFERGE